MKIVIASDAFKGCMSSNEVNNNIEKGIKNALQDAEIVKIPLADGGEGTVKALIEGCGGEYIEVMVRDPLMRKVQAQYGILADQTAVIEIAECVGLTLLSETERNPLFTTTYGVGEMIKDAINKGSRNFIIGIGGSATNDCGMGMLEALGYEFFDAKRNKLKGIGKSLNLVKYMDDSKKEEKLTECKFSVLCDVNNPLYGESGAAYVYAKQKGADDNVIAYLDKGLRNFASFVDKTLNKDIGYLARAGAAGGLGGGLSAFLKGELLSGIEVIFKQLEIEKVVKDANYIVTGEGKIDIQSVMGKVLTGIGKLGKQYNIPVIGICGSLGAGIDKLHEMGISAMFSIINSPLDLETAMDKKNAGKLLEATVREIFMLIDTITKKNLSH